MSSNREDNESVNRSSIADENILDSETARSTRHLPDGDELCSPDGSIDWCRFVRIMMAAVLAVVVVVVLYVLCLSSFKIHKIAIQCSRSL